MDTLLVGEERLRRSFQRVVDDDRGGYFAAIARGSDGACAGIGFAALDRRVATLAILAQVYWFYVASEYGGGAEAKLVAAFCRWAEKRGAADGEVESVGRSEYTRTDGMSGTPGDTVFQFGSPRSTGDGESAGGARPVHQALEPVATTGSQGGDDGAAGLA